MPNTSGLVAKKGQMVNYDAAVVTRLKKAGAIPYMVTNVSELCMWYESANHLNGRTRNPYNTSRIVGGSSGQFWFAFAISFIVVFENTLFFFYGMLYQDY